jgi:hypothetical protein
MKIHTGFEQGSLDWGIIRAGKVTSSELDALVTPLGKVRTGDGVRTYLHKKLAEKWSGAPLASLQGIFDVEQGQFLEDQAKPAFTLETGIDIQNVAFISTDDGFAGCSPDGLICDKDGNPTSGVEIKCPRLETHVGYLLGDELPSQYVAQVQGSMWVTGVATWHFFSYRRKLPPLHLVIERDETYQEAIKIAVESFKESFDAGWLKLVEKNGGEPTRPIISQPKPEGFDNIP